MILGLDASTTWLGWAVYNEASQRIESSGQRKLTGAIEAKLAQAHALLCNLPELCHVTLVAIEQPFVGKNGHTTLLLGQMWGALALTAQLCNRLRVDILPAEAKLAATGNGHADKQLVGWIVGKRFGLSKVGEHEADAIAVAIAAATKIKLRELEGV